ncbi:TetR family transcriptional regulator [Komagataeibacter medellinensis]|uniref:TetR family transcriptional regulator n=1 Tax=Komagataeibacter medellinensis TaxID=1177712 RepID=A0ABQ6VX97_9PROT|nr:TetR family transcriptional regulator [Komagataeibacter medellinensis]KAB8124255.1 TetR family transcriptional regulator [Komagataeibacter medellinensis]
MDNDQFDATLLRSALERAALHGWRRTTVVDAARDVGLSLDTARKRFACKTMLLMALGRLADEAALVEDGSEGSVREKLFDMLMRRLDVFQQYREGVRAVLRAVPLNPPLAIVLGGATVESMKWIADAAGMDTTGLAGAMRLQALLGVWTLTLRTWDKDDSQDMGLTMAALDQALDRAARFTGLGPATPQSTTAGTAHDADTDPMVDLPLEPFA